MLRYAGPDLGSRLEFASHHPSESDHASSKRKQRGGFRDLDWLEFVAGGAESYLVQARVLCGGRDHYAEVEISLPAVSHGESRGLAPG